MISKGLATGIAIDGLIQDCSQTIQDLLLRGQSDDCGGVGCRKDEVDDFGGWSTSHLFRVCVVLSDLVNRKTGIVRHLTIYAHSTE